MSISLPLPSFSAGGRIKRFDHDHWSDALTFRKGTIPQPGGDKSDVVDWIPTSVDLNHWAQFIFDAENALFRVEAKKLKGCYILLDEASVTGTANLIMAAVMAEGTTTIYNAACEPYVQQLCRMLISMGQKLTAQAPTCCTFMG